MPHAARRLLIRTNMTHTPHPDFDYLIGVDGGGTGTRARLADLAGNELGQGHGGPSGLINGTGKAWAAVESAIGRAFDDARLAAPAHARLAIGLGLAGVH